MTCYACGQTRYSRVFGRWFTPSGIKWLRVRCDSQACGFKYTSIDGQERNGQPTWMVPAQEAPHERA